MSIKPTMTPVSCTPGIDWQSLPHAPQCPSCPFAKVSQYGPRCTAEPVVLGELSHLFSWVDALVAITRGQRTCDEPAGTLVLQMLQHSRLKRSSLPSSCILRWSRWWWFNDYCRYTAYSIIVCSTLQRAFQSGICYRIAAICYISTIPTHR